MTSNKDLLIKDLGNDGRTPSHLEKEMYEQMTRLNKQINAINKILEECK